MNSIFGSYETIKSVQSHKTLQNSNYFWYLSKIWFISILDDVIVNLWRHNDVIKTRNNENTCSAPTEYQNRLKLNPKLIEISWIQGGQLILLSLDTNFYLCNGSKLSKISWPPCIQLISISFGYNLSLFWYSVGAEHVFSLIEFWRVLWVELTL